MCSGWLVRMLLLSSLSMKSTPSVRLTWGVGSALCLTNQTATKRFDAGTGADREVQRVLLELLTQMDGFDQSVNVKVIMCTNRHETLDPAILRPGRLDRKIEFPNPDRRQKRLVFQVICSKMNLGDDVDLESFVSRPEKISAAEIQSICLEAGMQAVRKNRYVVLAKDFETAYKKIVKKSDSDYDFYQ
mmetsp:Transcript_46426/g.119828  ORF Transcript_46426/g.119828 Transcript_46426/m.119828 type:complete len:188 (-) Transcript_46426:26-589(-)